MIKRLMHLTLAVISCMILLSCEDREDSGAKQVISKHRVIYTKPPGRIPVPHSVDAPLLGNGYTGVAISGQPEKQVYYLARNDFWRLKHGYQESFPAVLGKLEISIPGLEGSSYLVEQDLYEAKTWAQFLKPGSEVSFKTYVSATEDLMIIEIELEGEGELKGSVNLELPGEPELASDLPEGYSYPAETRKGITDNGIGYISRAFVEDVEIPT
jgi:alpha-L-fucosidase 2